MNWVLKSAKLLQCHRVPTFSHCISIKMHRLFSLTYAGNKLLSQEAEADLCNHRLVLLTPASHRCIYTWILVWDWMVVDYG